jgi:hypothetical protein
MCVVRPGGGSGMHPLPPPTQAGSVTINAKTTVHCSPRFLHAPHPPPTPPPRWRKCRLKRGDDIYKLKTPDISVSQTGKVDSNLFDPLIWTVTYPQTSDSPPPPSRSNFLVLSIYPSSHLSLYLSQSLYHVTISYLCTYVCL